MKTKQEYLLSIPFDYLLRFIGHSYLVRPKNDYFTKKDFVRRIIRTLSASDCEWLHSMYLHKIPSRKAAELYLTKYPTAKIIRTAFVDYVTKEVHDDIGEISYEFPIPKTRVDIARIQGESYAYELKSIRDTNRRIEYQVNSIRRLFERVYLVIPKEKNLLTSISLNKKVGIYHYLIEDKNIIFKRRRKAYRMTTFDSLGQLQLFHIDELANYFSNIFKTNSGTMSRRIMEQKIIDKLSSRKINHKFKQVLKNRFQQFPNNNFTLAR